MFERASANMLATIAACAAVVVAVVAAGFAVYALALPYWGPAGAAAATAAAAALLVGACALFTHHQAKAKEREAALAQENMMRALPLSIGDLARDHPIASVVATLVAGLVAARHPRLSRDLISIVARFTER
ncbi:MAG: hypothetical protein NW206_12735 [Hyphomonadaceae bacterium]|nr:hypothetical protein [Hyphomonadaceae bacterium]